MVTSGPYRSSRVHAETRTGELLIEMAAKGKRHKGHGDQKSGSRHTTPILKDFDITQLDRCDGYGDVDAYAYEAPVDDSAVAYCVQRFRSYDPASGTYLGNDGYRHPCP